MSGGLFYVHSSRKPLRDFVVCHLMSLQPIAGVGKTMLEYRRGSPDRVSPASVAGRSVYEFSEIIEKNSGVVLFRVLMNGLKCEPMNLQAGKPPKQRRSRELLAVERSDRTAC